MISHGPLRVRAGKTKYSPTPGIRLNATAVNFSRGHHIIDVSESERAHRRGVRSVRCVGFEEARDFAFSRSDDRQVIVLGILVEFLHADVLNYHLAAALFKFFGPAGEFHALIDGLAGAIELGFPEESFIAIGAGNGEGDAVGVGAFLFPEIDSEVAFILKRIIEHELAGGDAAFADLIGRAIRNDGYVVAVFLAGRRRVAVRIVRRR